MDRIIPTTVYRFFDVDGALLYVGITSVGPTRWFQHAKVKGWWDEVASITTEHYANRRDAEAIEATAIRNESPRYNVAGLRPVKPSRIGLMRGHGMGSLFYNVGIQRWSVIAPRAFGRKTWTFHTRPEAEGLLTIFRLARLGPAFRSAAIAAIEHMGK